MNTQLAHTQDTTPALTVGGSFLSVETERAPSMAELKVQYPVDPDKWDVATKGTIPPDGCWKVWNSGSISYSDAVSFRVLHRTYFITRKDNDGKTTASTVEFMDMGERNSPDTEGGNRLGKMTVKDKKALPDCPESEAILEQQKTLVFWERLYVLLDIDGKDADGEANPMKDVVAIYDVKATSRGAWTDYLDTFKVQSDIVNKYHNATLKRKIKGVVAFYVPELVVGAPVKDDEGTKALLQDTMVGIASKVDDTNAKVISAFNKVNGFQGPSNTMRDVTVEASRFEEDDIPF